MPRLIPALLVLLLAACGPHQSSLPRLYEVPDASLVADDGSTLPLSSLEGSVVVYDFVFTNCDGACPLMMKQMQGVIGRFAQDDEIRFVSLSVDPERDTPERLSEFAERVRSDERWTFATGEPGQVLDLSVKGFKLAAGEAGPREEPILHSSRFVLVDRKGWIRGYYDSMDPEMMKQLVIDARDLLEEPA